MGTSEVVKEEKTSEEVGVWICSRMDEGHTFELACSEARRRFTIPKQRPERKECPLCLEPLEEIDNLFLCSNCNYSASLEELHIVYSKRMEGIRS